VAGALGTMPFVVIGAIVAAYVGWRIWRSRRIEAEVEQHEAAEMAAEAAGPTDETREEG